jgi:hypothetical protein
MVMNGLRRYLAKFSRTGEKVRTVQKPLIPSGFSANVEVTSLALRVKG